MYHQHGIEKLSKPQVSKLLNGHRVRVKHGAHHTIHVSEEHSKRIHRSHKKGAAATIQLDPHAIGLNQHLRGGSAWTQLGRNTSNNLGVLSNAGTNYLVDKMGGDSSTPTAGAGMRRRGRPKKHSLHLGELNEMMHMHGGKVNRLKKYEHWTGALGHSAQAIGKFVKPVAQPILHAATQRAVSEINPSYEQQLMNYAMGMGVKKRRGRPRKHHGGALMAAGY